MINILFALCNSAILSFDIGSYYSKISVGNLMNNGKLGKNNMNNSMFLTYFSLWNISNSQQEIKKKHWSLADLRECSWSYGENNEIFHENFINNISFLNIIKNGLMKRESLAIYIRHLLKEINQNINETKAVLAVDPFLNVQDRYMMREVFKMAGLNIINIIDSPAAIAYLFAIQQSNYYKESGKNVMFIDIGESKTWISIFNFKFLHGKPNVSQISLSYNKNFGGKSIDEYLLNVINENKSINLSNENLNDIRNIRKNITNFNPLNIELNGIKFQINETDVSRIISNFTDQIYYLYQEVIQQSNLSKIQIDLVEYVGGITKIPFVNNLLNDIFGIYKINQSIYQENAIALGAGYIGSFMVSKPHSNLDIQMNSFCNSNVSIVHNNKTISLFKHFNYLKDSYIYQFNLRENNFISIQNDNPLCEIVKFKLNIPISKNDSIVKIYFGFDDFSLPGIYKILINNVIFNNISFYSPNWTITRRMLNQSLAFFKRIDDISEERRKTQEALINFTQFFNECKSLILTNKTIQKVMTGDEIKSIYKKIDNNIIWLSKNRNNHILTSKIIKNKFKEICKTIKKIKRRANELLTSPKALTDLFNKIQEVNKTLHEIWPKTRPWLTEKDKKTISDSLNHAQKYYFLYKEANANKKDTDDPNVLTKDIEIQKYYLEITYNHTLASTSHPPTPTPAKTPKRFVTTYKSFKDFDLSNRAQSEL